MSTRVRFGVWANGARALVAEVAVMEHNGSVFRVEYFRSYSARAPGDQDVKDLCKKYGLLSVARMAVTGAFDFVREYEREPTRAEVRRVMASWRRQGFEDQGTVEDPQRSV